MQPCFCTTHIRQRMLVTQARRCPRAGGGPRMVWEGGPENNGPTPWPGFDIGCVLSPLIHFVFVIVELHRLQDSTHCPCNCRITSVVLQFLFVFVESYVSPSFYSFSVIVEFDGLHVVPSPKGGGHRPDHSGHPGETWCGYPSSPKGRGHRPDHSSPKGGTQA